jgi:hypothetical protein
VAEDALHGDDVGAPRPAGHLRSWTSPAEALLGSLNPGEVKDKDNRLWFLLHPIGEHAAAVGKEMVRLSPTVRTSNATVGLIGSTFSQVTIAST